MSGKRVASAICLSLFCVSGQALADLYGPIPYLQASDSPFSSLAFGVFYLEDFEDGLLNTPGVSVSGGFLTRSYYTDGIDSVDADDGVIDGHGDAGQSWFFTPGSQGITFTFDAGVLGVLPTHAGIVWTDGRDPVTFQAFNISGESLGTVGPIYTADDNYLGGTAEDRFFGVSDPLGIWQITIANAANSGIEVDHLQYGLLQPVPLPGAALLGVLGLGYAGTKLRRHR